MPKMRKRKSAKNGNSVLLKNAETRKTVLVKNAENIAFSIFRVK
jgi:hypothetical protein